MKNMLIITSHLPYPLTSGGNQAQFYMNDFLRSYYNITILYNENKVNDSASASSLNKIWPDVKLIPYNWKRERDWMTVIKGKLFRKTTALINKSLVDMVNMIPDQMMTPSFIDFVYRIIQQCDINIVQVEFNHFLPVVTILPAYVKKVFVQHEIQYVRYGLQKNINQEDRRDLYRFQYEMMRGIEIALMNRYDKVITLTEVDRQKLIKDGVVKNVVSSPACVTSQKCDIAFTPTRTNVVFVGGCRHYPNYDGLLWFLNNVWKGVLKEMPDTKLLIIGEWGAKEKNIIIEKFESVEFVGFVDNLTTYLSNSVMIVPIRIGSGMRMKIVESANIGCPFISTSVGVEGLNFVPGKDFLLADSPDDFKINLLRLLASESLQLAFSNNVKQIFTENYSLLVLGKKRLDALNSL